MLIGDPYSATVLQMPLAFCYTGLACCIVGMLYIHAIHPCLQMSVHANSHPAEACAARCTGWPKASALQLCRSNAAGGVPSAVPDGGCFAVIADVTMLSSAQHVSA